MSPPAQSGMLIRFMARSDSSSNPLLRHDVAQPSSLQGRCGADLKIPYGFFLLKSMYKMTPLPTIMEGYTNCATLGEMFSSPLHRLSLLAKSDVGVSKGGQNNRHVSVRPTCCRHVGRHVGNTTQKAVGRGTEPTCHSMSLADMSAICRQYDKYLAVGFEPMSMLLVLDSPATLPVRTCVLFCRVAGISSNISAA